MVIFAFSHTTENPDFLSAGTYMNQNGGDSGILTPRSCHSFCNLLLSEGTEEESGYWLDS